MHAIIDAATFGENFGRLATLFVPTALGWALSRIRLMPNGDAAVGGINAFVLFGAFPALIANAVLVLDTSSVSGWGFWAVTPLVLAIGVGVARLTNLFGVGRVGGTTALILLYGNTAFLGIPYVVAMFGEEARGPAAVSVAIQVSVGALLGPVLLNRWSGAGAGVVQWRRLLTQPLFWSPFVGLAARALPAGARDAVSDGIAPLGACAAPTAMFVLGTYFARPAAEREGSRRAGVVVGAVCRLLVMPAATAAVAGALVALDAMDPLVAAVMVVLMACPAAVSTFPMAENEGVEPATVATLVVVTGLASLLTLTLFASVAAALW